MHSRSGAQSKSSTLLDVEAEEEEEEGLQAGLGDFGFGVTSKMREIDQERVRAVVVVVVFTCNAALLHVKLLASGGASSRRR